MNILDVLIGDTIINIVNFLNDYDKIDNVSISFERSTYIKK